MLYSEVEDCEDCLLFQKDICKGGFTITSNGPVEPPCCSFDDDTDLDQWIEDFYDAQRQYEDYIDKKLKVKQEKKQKAEIAKEKREYVKNYCIGEIRKVKELKKMISKQQRALSNIEAMVNATNMVNEIFQYSNRAKVNEDTVKAIETLQEKLVEAEKELKKKQREAKNTEGYKNICNQ